MESVVKNVLYLVSYFIEYHFAVNNTLNVFDRTKLVRVTLGRVKHLVGTESMTLVPLNNGLLVNLDLGSSVQDLEYFCY